jgi:hypothetical protein
VFLIMLQVLNAARKAALRVFYALHHRYRPGDYETWKYIAPVQKASWLHKGFEYGTWGGEIRREFEPQPGEIVALTTAEDRLAGSFIGMRSTEASLLCGNRNSFLPRSARCLDHCAS